MRSFLIFSSFLVIFSLTIILSIESQYIFAQNNEDQLHGIVYSPVKTNLFSEDIVKDDISVIDSIAQNIRLYKIDDSTEIILKNAHGLKVTLGIDFTGKSKEQIKQELKKAVEFTRKYPDTIHSIVVGNDAIAQNQITVNELVEYLDYFKTNGIRITSANSSHVWYDYPMISKKVDYLLLYSFDFWKGLDVEQAATNSIEQHDAMKQRYPDKPIILEVGWPSNGNPINNAIPSEKEQQKFLELFLNLARQNDIQYYIFEYANESWKPAKDNNTAENHWGLFYEEDRMIKPHFSGFFEFESTSHVTQINEKGQAVYVPTIKEKQDQIIIQNYNDSQEKILKVSIPENISHFTYKIDDDKKEQTIKTDGRSTILFIKTSNTDNIKITTEKYSDEISFSLIPQAFATCPPDITCHNINYQDDFDVLSIILILVFIMVFFITVLKYYQSKPKEWDYIHIKQIKQTRYQFQSLR